MQNTVYERKQNGEDFILLHSVTDIRFGNCPANGLVTEQPQYSVVVCIFSTSQNTEISLIPNGLRLIYTCSLLLALPCIFHVGRHTFATTVYLCNGGTIEALSKILGHKHISTTQIYAEVTNRMVSSDFRAISGNLAAMQRSVLEKKDRKQDGKRVRRSLRETA